MSGGRRGTARRGSGALLGLVEDPFACTSHVQLGQVGTMTVRG